MFTSVSEVAEIKTWLIHWVSECVSEWQGHLLSCPGQLKRQHLHANCYCLSFFPFLGARERFSMPRKTCPPNLNLPSSDTGGWWQFKDRGSTYWVPLETLANNGSNGLCGRSLASKLSALRFHTSIHVFGIIFQRNKRHLCEWIKRYKCHNWWWLNSSNKVISFKKVTS